MNSTSSPGPDLEIPAFVDLQREIHDALLLQHPEWFHANGSSPICDDYDRRLAELLRLSLTLDERRRDQYS